MTKNIPLAALIATSLLFVSSNADMASKIGLGVGLSEGTSVIRVPIKLNDNFRLEPEVGFSYSSKDSSTDTTFSMGTGAYLLSQLNSNTVAYYGGKARLVHTSYDYKTSDDSTTQLSLGGVFGFEHMLDTRVSIGGEAGAYIGVGDKTTINTNTQAILRFYL